ncbi:lysophospholipid acyltransferase family protein [Ornithinimicrobium cerasi]|uniref:1-acyl-sn-glycerol-3-phosphate acyltransferases n=1 Tax=Ornithinimicrobium cerasi TaxID=2248773 RepID=A0A285VB13_9MICO|nr:lysophospholipid acyltransferase family protein [Ornithinimicrobium cerasi]SOC51279.1 1-acyl-sn-glycerol-3-phosphate acyltransferases [Ornithinimicrobium cerasi]
MGSASTSDRTTRPPARATWGARARHVLWRAMSTLVGGVRIGGRVPSGPMVLVANHTSHADTAALLAAVPPDRRPTFVAAADYWFARPWRRALVSGLVGALPVARTGAAYETLRDAAAPVLAEGRALVIYPEGTRGAPGEPVGPFRSGALRLAADLDVPLVPVGISGTGEVLPKHGRLRPTGVVLRFGDPLPGAVCRDTSPEVVRAAVQALRDDSSAVPWPDSRLYGWLERRSDVQLMTAGLLWGFAEALSWPVMAEVYVVAVGAPQPHRAGRVGASVAAGSVAGVLVHAALARRGVRLPAPLATPAMRTAARDHLRSDGALGIWRQLRNGIPVKVYARAAGESDLALHRLAGAVALARPTRMALATGVVLVAGGWAHPLLRRRYPEFLVLGSAVFAEGLHRVVRRWR